MQNGVDNLPIGDLADLDQSNEDGELEIVRHRHPDDLLGPLYVTERRTGEVRHLRLRGARLTYPGRTLHTVVVTVSLGKRLGLRRTGTHSTARLCNFHPSRRPHNSLSSRRLAFDHLHAATWLAASAATRTKSARKIVRHLRSGHSRNCMDFRFESDSGLRLEDTARRENRNTHAFRTTLSSLSTILVLSRTKLELRLAAATVVIARCGYGRPSTTNRTCIARPAAGSAWRVLGPAHDSTHYAHVTSSSRGVHWVSHCSRMLRA